MNRSAVHEDIMIGVSSIIVYGLLEQEEIIIMENRELCGFFLLN